MFSDNVVFFDIESDSSEYLWDQDPDEFFRVAGYAWGDTGVVQYTTSRLELIDVLESAKVMVGHNIHQFDLTAIYGKDSTRPLELSLENRVFDTLTHATIYNPAPYVYTNWKGKRALADTPGKAMKFFSLNEQAHQLGVQGKVDELDRLAKKYGGYGNIPLDDPEYLFYLEGDVLATRTVAVELVKRSNGVDDYSWREQINAAIDAQNSRNGWLVDQEAARERVAEQERIKDEHLSWLHENFAFPTSGKMPLRSKLGKQAVLKALESVGIEEWELPRTKDKQKKDTDRSSLAGKGIMDVAKRKGEDAQRLAKSIAIIGGLRPLAQQALDNCHADGMNHFSITTMQVSGRKSTTKSGITTWTSRGPGKIEKIYWLPDRDDHVLREYDYSQADARIVAAYSGDSEFAKRFAPGADAHMITAELVWGYDVVHESEESEALYRQLAKAQNHAYAYRCGPKTLSKQAGVPLETSEKFVREMQRAYPLVTRWQERVTKLAEAQGYLINDWGRLMPVDKKRAYTQGPAQMGQSGTREIMVDSLIRMARRDIRIIKMLKGQIHDALVFSIPEAELDYWHAIIVECMETEWGPSDGTGQVVKFPVSFGPAAKNWMDCEH